MPRTKRVDSTVEVSPEETTIIKEMAVVSLYPARLEYAGAATGKVYRWDGAGSIAMVSLEDIPPLLSKRIGNRSCCGARQGGNKVFELLQEAQ